MKYTNEMSFSDIEKAIPLLAKRGATFRADIQKLIVSVARQWHQHGNVAHAAKLLTSIATEVEGYYGQAISDYCCEKFGFTWAKGAFVYTETKLEAKALEDVLRGKPFWEFSPPKAIKGKDMLGMLNKLLADNAKYSSPEEHAKRMAEGREDILISLDVAREIRGLLSRQAA